MPSQPLAFLQRAAQGGWCSEEEEDSEDDDIRNIPEQKTSQANQSRCWRQADVEALESAMCDAARMVEALRKVGRDEEANYLEDLMHTSGSQLGSDSDSDDIVHADDLD
ncbi:hypothetical protein CYMTET_28144 [Cymbomonas tetramitiformis]|uniref:Uncharacterized protein n=1 Tax=Cymbomonas tetramitiformis TaxID=36881 RepID=A0AAE0KWI3_9CHLO|nr:hypothetical protein CYMTET_28144 [Cymbomonas tetramitiformis]